MAKLALNTDFLSFALGKSIGLTLLVLFPMKQAMEGSIACPAPSWSKQAALASDLEKHGKPSRAEHHWDRGVMQGCLQCGLRFEGGPASHSHTGAWNYIRVFIWGSHLLVPRELFLGIFEDGRASERWGIPP